MNCTTNQICSFELAGQLYGVEACIIQEVILYHKMTTVPLADSAISGLINLRGQIVTAIDMRKRMQLPPNPSNRPPMNLVIRTDDGAVSLLVDQIGDVFEVDDSEFEPPPETLEGVPRSMIRGAYKLRDRLLLLLDCEAAIAID